MNTLATFAIVAIPLLCALVGINAVVYLLGPPAPPRLPADWKPEDERRVP